MKIFTMGEGRGREEIEKQGGSRHGQHHRGSKDLQPSKKRRTLAEMGSKIGKRATLEKEATYGEVSEQRGRTNHALLLTSIVETSNL